MRKRKKEKKRKKKRVGENRKREYEGPNAMAPHINYLNPLQLALKTQERENVPRNNSQGRSQCSWVASFPL